MSQRLRLAEKAASESLPYITAALIRDDEIERWTERVPAAARDGIPCYFNAAIALQGIPVMPEVSWLSLLQALQAARSNDAINAALAAISRAARADFISDIARELERPPREGHEMVLEDAESLLNDVLYKLYANAARFRGTSDAEAEAFVRMIFNNALRDASKTALRRESVWKAVLDYLRGRAERQRGVRGEDEAGEE